MANIRPIIKETNTIHEYKGQPFILEEWYPEKKMGIVPDIPDVIKWHQLTNFRRIGYLKWHYPQVYREWKKKGLIPKDKWVEGIPSGSEDGWRFGPENAIRPKEEYED